MIDSVVSIPTLAQAAGSLNTLFGGAIAGAMIVLLCVTAISIRRMRHRRDLTALAYVEQAVRLNLPLNTVLAAAQAGETGRLAVNLGAMVRDLEEGMAVSDAIAMNLPALPARVPPLLAAAERSGCLAPQLQRVLRQEHSAFQRQHADDAFATVYPVVVLIAVAGVLGYATAFIAPKFARIFEDFDLALPAMTQFILSDRTTLLGGIIMALAGLTLTVLAILAIVQIASLKPNTFAASDMVRRLLWRLPIARGIEVNRGHADLFDLLADSLEAGQPLHVGLDHAACRAINPVLRGRVRDWGNKVRGGAAMDEAAREAGLAPLAVAMLRSGQAAGNLPEVCRFLARYYAGRHSAVAALVRGAIVPCSILALALPVGVVVYALFIPIVRMIENMTATCLIV